MGGKCGIFMVGPGRHLALHGTGSQISFFLAAQFK